MGLIVESSIWKDVCLRELLVTCHRASVYILPHVIHVLQFGPEDRWWRSLPGFGHMFSGAPLCQQRHDHLPLLVRWVQLSTGEPFASLSSDWQPEFQHFPEPSFLLLQGPFVFFFRIVFNKEARNAMKYCCSRKHPDHMIKSKAAVSPAVSHIWYSHSDVRNPCLFPNSFWKLSFNLVYYYQ